MEIGSSKILGEILGFNELSNSCVLLVIINVGLKTDIDCNISLR